MTHDVTGLLPGVGAGVVGEVARDELLDTVEEALAQVVAVEQLQLAEHLDQVVRPALVLRDEGRHFGVDGLAKSLEQREFAVDAAIGTGGAVFKVSV